jgi:type I restriction-modification system DNA methylase subunit
MPDPNLSSFLWSVADLLRGDYKQSDYGKVILPFTVLRRLDCVLEATKPAVLAERGMREKAGLNPEPFLLKKEIPFNRHFYVFRPPRPLSEIDAELKGVTDRILAMIGGQTQ